VAVAVGHAVGCGRHNAALNLLVRARLLFRFMYVF
jgi:hypothetical protein